MKLGIVTAACLLLCTPLLAQKLELRATLQGHNEKIVSLAFSSDGKTLASGSADNSIKLWKVATGGNPTTLKGAGAFMWCWVAFSPDGKMLASGGGGNQIKLWNVATGKSTTILDRADQYAMPRVVFSPDGKILASGGLCIRRIKLWDAVTGRGHIPEFDLVAKTD
jgi:WD40 repeat protein